MANCHTELFFFTNCFIGSLFLLAMTESLLQCNDYDYVSEITETFCCLYDLDDEDDDHEEK